MNLEKLMEEKNAVLETITEKCQKLEAENQKLRLELLACLGQEIGAGYEEAGDD